MQRVMETCLIEDYHIEEKTHFVQKPFHINPSLLKVQHSFSLHPHSNPALSEAELQLQKVESLSKLSVKHTLILQSAPHQSSYFHRCGGDIGIFDSSCTEKVRKGGVKYVFFWEWDGMEEDLGIALEGFRKPVCWSNMR